MFQLTMKAVGKGERETGRETERERERVTGQISQQQKLWIIVLNEDAILLMHSKEVWKCTLEVKVLSWPSTPLNSSRVILRPLAMSVR